MPLLGKAALLLSFDIAPEAVAEHDDWHTHEHLPERLAIPGFLRGSRWTALRGEPRYFVLYEAEDVQTLVSDAYLRRLDNPTPWTSRIMPLYRGMARGLCAVASSHGVGLGHIGLLIRYTAPAQASAGLQRWLCGDVLPGLPAQPGLGAAHLLQAAAEAPMTNEQRIRGADAGVGSAVLVTGYGAASIEALAEAELSTTRFEAHGARQVTSGLYRADYTLTANDIEVTDG